MEKDASETLLRLKDGSVFVFEEETRAARDRGGRFVSNNRTPFSPDTLMQQKHTYRRSELPNSVLEREDHERMVSTSEGPHTSDAGSDISEESVPPR